MFCRVASLRGSRGGYVRCADGCWEAAACPGTRAAACGAHAPNGRPGGQQGGVLGFRVGGRVTLGRGGRGGGRTSRRCADVGGVGTDVVGAWGGQGIGGSLERATRRARATSPAPSKTPYAPLLCAVRGAPAPPKYARPARQRTRSPRRAASRAATGCSTGSPHWRQSHRPDRATRPRG